MAEGPTGSDRAQPALRRPFRTRVGADALDVELARRLNEWSTRPEQADHDKSLNGVITRAVAWASLAAAGVAAIVLFLT
jgi:hypothetical protein